MRVSQIVLIAAVVAAPVASAVAGPVVRLGPAPMVFPHAPGPHQASWSHGDGDHDFGRRHHRRDFIGPIAPVFSVTTESEAAPAPLFFSAPVFINITSGPAEGPALADWPQGPKIIEIGQSDPPRGRLPLIIYGD